MPTYRYRCADCGHDFEQVQKFADDPLTVCPSCNGTIRRVIQPVGVVFKGSGWYINDSRKSESSSTPKSAESADKGATKSESSGGTINSEGSAAAEKPAKAETKESAAPAKSSAAPAAAGS